MKRKSEKANEKKSRNKNKKRPERPKMFIREIVGIFLFGIGIFLLLSYSLKGSTGLLGEALRNFTLGLFGIIGFSASIIIIAVSIFMVIRKDTELFYRKINFISILIFIISAIIQTYYYRPEDYIGLSPLDSLVKFYNDGIAMNGGGIIGGLVSTPFLYLFQIIGTFVFLITLAIIDIVIIFDASIAAAFSNLRKTNDNNISKQKKHVFLERNIEKNIKISSHEIEKEENKKKKRKDNNNDISFFERIIKGKEVLNKENKNVEVQQVGTKSCIQDDTKSIEKKSNSKNENDAGKKSFNTTNTANSDNTTNTVKSVQIKYEYPSLDLLDYNRENGEDMRNLKAEILEDAKKLEETLASFGVDAKVVNVSRGPAVTRYEVSPGSGVKVSSIVKLSDDIALSLAAAGVRMEAPIPGKSAVGIEVPNKKVSPVFLREILESQEFKKHPSRLAFAVGKDISGSIVVGDIAKMPHLLIAGATGSGKSVCLNSMIISLLYKASPHDVRLLMIDPKVVELGIYNGIPHLLIPVVTEPKKACGALNWAVVEMTNRYRMFAERGVRDINGYNASLKLEEKDLFLPQIVIIIDELSDLMMVAPKEIEDSICRLAQMARAAGMHLVIATQRPSVNVITGIIKANVPSRIAFAVSSQVDSRTILDMIGAEKLLGKGDMLFYPIGMHKPLRVKGTFVSDKEVEKIVDYIKDKYSTSYNESVLEQINTGTNDKTESFEDEDDMLIQAINFVVETGKASSSMLQRKFKLGYNRAARMIDEMEERGIVSPLEGSKRKVLISKQEWMEMQMAKK